jgi:D-tyrosyl-tRNA(Tyr) deacylase
MRLLLQRVSEARVTVDGNTVGSIRTGLLILAGMAKTDTESEIDYLSDKVLALRIFPDSAGKMNRNIVDAGGSLLIVSQFTLYGDCRKGRRPSFDDAATPRLFIIISCTSCEAGRCQWRLAYFRRQWKFIW